jgi:hypothetical protein
MVAMFRDILVIGALMWLFITIDNAIEGKKGLRLVFEELWNGVPAQKGK